MADDHHHNQFHTTNNWWDSTRNINNNPTNSPPSSSGLNNTNCFGNWSSTAGDSSTTAGGSDCGGAGGDLVDPNLHMMGLGLYNQTLLRGGGAEDKGEGSFRSMLQENLNSIPSYHHQHQHQQEATNNINIGSSHQVQWRDKIFLDQTQLSSPSSENSSVSYHVDSSSLYGGGNSSTNSLLQGFIGSGDQNQYGGVNYGAMNMNSSNNNININNDLLGPSWSRPNSTTTTTTTNNIPQFLRASSSPPKQVVVAAAPPQQNITETKKSSGGNEGPPAASKRPRNETSSPLPAFKVRKEKMGDRITALQQLVSPFGKTDTASVLSEAIEYIKFLHEQVNVLSTPYMKSGASSIHHQQQSTEKSKDSEGPKADLRSRGLCLVPVSSTFPVTHESPVDFWTPTFGGTFR
ncbi:hypothetical protein ACFE04_006655 [Oxalis oulophora]